MFEGYLGQALHVARVAARLSQEEVLHELNRRTESHFSLALFDGMEKDIEDISTETFNAWCELFPWGRDKILKCAQLLEQNYRRPEKEVLEDLLSEIKYQQWRNAQEGNE